MCHKHGIITVIYSYVVGRFKRMEFRTSCRRHIRQLLPLLRKDVRRQAAFCHSPLDRKKSLEKMKIKNPYFCCFSPTANPNLMLYASTTPDIYALKCCNGGYSNIFLTLQYNTVESGIQCTNQDISLK